jgi:hypothetical protein
MTKRKPAGNIAFVLLGAEEYRVSSFGSLFSFCPSLTFTIELLNNFLSLVTTFGRRRWGRRMDEAQQHKCLDVVR